MKTIAISLLFLLAACGSMGTDVYTNPGTHEIDIFSANDGAESTPIIWNGRLLLVTFNRPASGYYVTITDVETKQIVSTINAPDFTIGCAIVANGQLYIYGTSGVTVTGGITFGNQISVISSSDLVNWTAPAVVYQSAPGTAVWNVSVTPSPNGYIMAYDFSENTGETSPSQARFLTSNDLQTWQSLPGQLTGHNRYFASSTIRYSNGWYYVMYVQSYQAKDGSYYLPNVIARSQDLNNWEWAQYAVESPLGHSDYYGSATDADIAELNGQTIIFYLTGDQGGPRGTMIREAKYSDNLDNFLISHFNRGTQ